MRKKDLASLVSELDIDDGVKNTAVAAIRSGQAESALRMLEKYRRTILTDLHSGQEKLYQIDFVLQKARQEEKQ